MARENPAKASTSSCMTASKSFGAVRQVRKTTSIVVYVENAGDFEVPLSAVKDAEAEKVILDSARLTQAERSHPPGAYGRRPAHSVKQENIRGDE